MTLLTFSPPGGEEAGVLAAFLVAGLIGLGAFALLVIMLRTFVRVCPPNMVMVLQGAKTNIGGKTYGFRVIHGGRAIVIPILHRAELLDLSIIPINVRVEGVNSANGITVGADATACVCVDVEDNALLYTAVERMLGRSRAEIQEQIQQTMIGNFRGAMNRTTPLEALGMVESAEKLDMDEPAAEAPVADPGGQAAGGATESQGTSQAGEHDRGDRARFRQELLTDSNEDLSSFGMRVVSVSFQRIWDSSDYIANLANKSVARMRQNVEVEEAKLRAQAESAESDSNRREQIAKNRADEQIIEARQNLGVTERECQARVEQARLEADANMARAHSEAEEQVEKARIELRELKNTSEVTLQAEYEKQAAEIHAEGDDQATRIVRQMRNTLLEQKAKLLSESDRAGRVPLFVQQQLERLFEAYLEHAEHIKLDNIVMMNEQDGVAGVVNRGPVGMVAFLRHFEQAFGIRIRDMVDPEADHDASDGNGTPDNAYSTSAQKEPDQ